MNYSNMMTGYHRISAGGRPPEDAKLFPKSGVQDFSGGEVSPCNVGDDKAADATRTLSDTTFEKERLSALSKLELVPDEIVSECLGATSQFNSATAGLGLFARNRGTRRALAKTRPVQKSHQQVTLEK